MYRFKQAASAIGISEPALRAWLTRENLGIWDDRPQRGWRTFTDDDISKLALVAELVSYNAKVKEAFDLIESIVLSVGKGDPARLPDALEFLRVNGRFHYLKNPGNNGFTPYGRLTIYPANIIAAAKQRLEAFEGA